MSKNKKGMIMILSLTMFMFGVLLLYGYYFMELPQGEDGFWDSVKLFYVMQSGLQAQSLWLGLVLISLSLLILLNSYGKNRKGKWSK